jgi:hypothetical protein
MAYHVDRPTSIVARSLALTASPWIDSAALFSLVFSVAARYAGIPKVDPSTVLNRERVGKLPVSRYLASFAPIAQFDESANRQSGFVNAKALASG